eukprot:360262-Chlamydomonas_euryale.AAC.4
MKHVERRGVELTRLASKLAAGGRGRRHARGRLHKRGAVSLLLLLQCWRLLLLRVVPSGVARRVQPRGKAAYRVFKAAAVAGAGRGGRGRRSSGRRRALRQRFVAAAGRHRWRDGWRGKARRRARKRVGVDRCGECGTRAAAAQRRRSPRGVDAVRGARAEVGRAAGGLGWWRTIHAQLIQGILGCGGRDNRTGVKQVGGGSDLGRTTRSGMEHMSATGN